LPGNGGFFAAGESIVSWEKWQGTHGSPQKLMENLEHLQETLNFEEKRSFPVDFPLKFIPRCPQFVIKLMW
jgi:hypothetical protein